MLLLMAMCSILSSGCHKKHNSQHIIIAIQPLGFSDVKQLKWLQSNIETYYHFKVILLPDMGLPEEAWYAPRRRYKADKLIRILKTEKSDSVQYIIGITSKDISTKKGEISDFGIMGLGFCPGKSCVVSTFRLKTADVRLLYERLAKVALHEIGHNLGLPHCTTKDCFMHDAEASIKQVDSEKLDLCSNCKSKI